MVKFHQPPLYDSRGHRVKRERASTTYGPAIERCFEENQRREPGYNRSWQIADILAAFFGVEAHVQFRERGTKRRWRRARK